MFAVLVRRTLALLEFSVSAVLCTGGLPVSNGQKLEAEVRVSFFRSLHLRWVSPLLRGECGRPASSVFAGEVLARNCVAGNFSGDQKVAGVCSTGFFRHSLKAFFQLFLCLWVRLFGLGCL